MSSLHWTRHHLRQQWAAAAPLAGIIGRWNRPNSNIDYLVPRREAIGTSFTVFGLTWPGPNPAHNWFQLFE